jgi:Domain of unknown function DUF11
LRLGTYLLPASINPRKRRRIMTTPTRPTCRRPERARQWARVGALAAVSAALGIGALAMPADAVAPAGQPDLQVTVSTSWNGTVPAGTRQVFTATVTNVGTAPSTQKTLLSEAWPGVHGIDYTASPGVDWFSGTGSITNIGPALEPGESMWATVTFIVAPGQTGVGQVEAEADVVTGELNYANNHVTVASTTDRYPTVTSATGLKSKTDPSASITKVNGIPFVQFGTELSLSVKVANATDGTVTISGIDASASAAVDKFGVATLNFKPTIRGLRSYTVSYSGSKFYQPSSMPYFLTLN